VKFGLKIPIRSGKNIRKPQGDFFTQTCSYCMWCARLLAKVGSLALVGVVSHRRIYWKTAECWSIHFQLNDIKEATASRYIEHFPHRPITALLVTHYAVQDERTASALVQGEFSREAQRTHNSAILYSVLEHLILQSNIA